MFHLLESIKIRDGVIMNSSLHEERMKHSAKDLFGCGIRINLEKLIKCPYNLVSGIVKCRIIYSASIDSITFEPYKPRLIQSLKLVYDDSIEYRHKYLDRNCLTNHLPGIEEDDILIVKNGLISDTSFSNVILWDGSRWLTPRTPLLMGTKRQQLLKNGFLSEADIRPEDIEHFSELRIINAMLDPMDNPGIKSINI